MITDYDKLYNGKTEEMRKGKVTYCISNQENYLIGSSSIIEI